MGLRLKDLRAALGESPFRERVKKITRNPETLGSAIPTTVKTFEPFMFSGHYT